MAGILHPLLLCLGDPHDPFSTQQIDTPVAAMLKSLRELAVQALQKGSLLLLPGHRALSVHCMNTQKQEQDMQEPLSKVHLHPHGEHSSLASSVCILRPHMDSTPFPKGLPSHLGSCSPLALQTQRMQQERGQSTAMPDNGLGNHYSQHPSG